LEGVKIKHGTLFVVETWSFVNLFPVLPPSSPLSKVISSISSSLEVASEENHKDD
jgi:hypothetical protein